MKTSVALIGFMGTGKTAVGRELSVKLDKRLIETDELIEQKAGKSIADIFKQDGEIAFREMEIAATKETANHENVVIACGGGVVLNKINVDRLRENGVIVCLTASPEVILERTSKDANGRPLLAVSDRFRQIEELLTYRQPFYERSADVTIDTTGLKVQAVVKKIIERLKEHDSQG